MTVLLATHQAQILTLLQIQVPQLVMKGTPKRGKILKRNMIPRIKQGGKKNQNIMKVKIEAKVEKDREKRTNTEPVTIVVRVRGGEVQAVTKVVTLTKNVVPLTPVDKPAADIDMKAQIMIVVGGEIKVDVVKVMKNGVVIVKGTMI